MKSSAQLHADQVYAAHAKRSIGGYSRKGLQEAVSLEKLTDWFKTVYAQIDDRIDRAKSGSQTEVETELRNLRSVMRDYEPRPGMDGEEATQHMANLHAAIRAYPESHAGPYRAYLQKIADEVDKAAKQGVTVAELELPAEAGELGAEPLPGEGTPLVEPTPPGATEPGLAALGGGEELPGAEGAIETGQEITI